MYSIDKIKDVHLELTSKCQARCPMCPRRINGGPINPLISLSEISLDTFKEWFPERFLKQLNSLFMCGNLGDPIIAQDCLEILQYIKGINPNIKLSMHTNGSARDIEWWQDLAKTGTRVVFGIDGIGEKHSVYRIGTDCITLCVMPKFLSQQAESQNGICWYLIIINIKSMSRET